MCHVCAASCDDCLLPYQLKYHVPPTYMKNQSHINERMRCILIDWLIQVHHKFTLLQETLYLTISTIDRYLQVYTLSVKTSLCNFELLGNTLCFVFCDTEQHSREDQATAGRSDCYAHSQQVRGDVCTRSPGLCLHHRQCLH